MKTITFTYHFPDSLPKGTNFFYITPNDDAPYYLNETQFKSHGNEELQSIIESGSDIYAVYWTAPNTVRNRRHWNFDKGRWTK